MGADWYEPFTIYGCEFVIPPDANYRKFVNKAYDLQSFVMEPFEIRGVLESFHSRMEGDIDDNRELDEMATVVIGFEPTINLEKMIELRDKLLVYIKDNVVFEGFDIVRNPKFYCGIEWHPGVDDNDDSDEDSEDDEEEEQESEDNQDQEDEEEEDEEEESEEDKQHTLQKGLNKIY